MDIQLKVQMNDPALALGVDSEPSLDLVSDATTRAASITNYERLTNKPSIENVELRGNKNLSDFGLETASDYDIAILFT